MNIRYAHFGNGIVVYMPTINDPDTNDCLIVAHINKHRVIEYRKKALAIKYLTVDVKKDIEYYSKTANPTISVTQDTPVFETKV